jgi:hypothetical protein
MNLGIRLLAYYPEIIRKSQKVSFMVQKVAWVSEKEESKI